MIHEVLDVMRQLARDGMTMVVVTHEMGFAREVCDRLVFIDGGQIVEEGRPAEFFANARSERAKDFLGKMLGHAPTRPAAGRPGTRRAAGGNLRSDNRRMGGRGRQPRHRTDPGRLRFGRRRHRLRPGGACTSGGAGSLKIGIEFDQPGPRPEEGLQITGFDVDVTETYVAEELGADAADDRLVRRRAPSARTLISTAAGRHGRGHLTRSPTPARKRSPSPAPTSSRVRTSSVRAN